MTKATLTLTIPVELDEDLDEDEFDLFEQRIRTDVLETLGDCMTPDEPNNYGDSSFTYGEPIIHFERNDED